MTQEENEHEGLETTPSAPELRLNSLRGGLYMQWTGEDNDPLVQFLDDVKHIYSYVIQEGDVRRAWDGLDPDQEEDEDDKYHVRLLVVTGHKPYDNATVPVGHYLAWNQRGELLSVSPTSFNETFPPDDTTKVMQGTVERLVDMWYKIGKK